MRNEFRFLCVDIQFDVPKWEFILKQQFKMLAVFLPIFVKDTKISPDYNFVAFLKSKIMVV